MKKSDSKMIIKYNMILNFAILFISDIERLLMGLSKFLYIFFKNNLIKKFDIIKLILKLKIKEKK